MITKNNSYQQVACKNGGCVIMKVIVMKLEMTCVPIILILIARTTVRTLSLIRCLENKQLHIIHRITPFTAYCGITLWSCYESAELL